MFKAPKYSTLLNPKDIPDGYLRKLFDPCKVTEHDFFIAVTEAHRRYQTAHEKWFRLLMKQHQKDVATGIVTRGSTPAMKKLEEEIEIASDGVTWLIGGLLGRYDEHNNARAIARMQELIKDSRRRSLREHRSERKKIIQAEFLQTPMNIRKGKKWPS